MDVGVWNEKHGSGGSPLVSRDVLETLPQREILIPFILSFVLSPPPSWKGDEIQSLPSPPQIARPFQRGEVCSPSGSPDLADRRRSGRERRSFLGGEKGRR